MDSTVFSQCMVINLELGKTNLTVLLFGSLPFRFLGSDLEVSNLTLDSRTAQNGTKDVALIQHKTGLLFFCTHRLIVYGLKSFV